VRVARGASEAEVRAAAEAEENISRHLAGMTIVKVIHVPDRLMNFVVRG
jgi:leucyl-tRNA synthetase